MSVCAVRVNMGKINRLDIPDGQDFLPYFPLEIIPLDGMAK